MSYVLTKLISCSPENAFADDEKTSLNTDEATFPWGIGGKTTHASSNDMTLLQLSFEQLKITFQRISIFRIVQN